MNKYCEKSRFLSKKRISWQKYFLFSFVLLLPGFIGCRPAEEIRTQKEPKIPTLNAPFLMKSMSKSGTINRIVGIALPVPTKEGNPSNGPDHWYIKLSGQGKSITPRISEIEDFIKSIQIKEGSEELTWTVPASWKETKAKTFSLATFILDKDLELTISRVGGSLLDNLNRWRDQVGLDHFKDLDQETKKISWGTKMTGIWVDFYNQQRETSANTDVNNDSNQSSNGPLKSGNNSGNNSNESTNKTRLIGAILPDGDSEWYFFKVMAPLEDVEPVAKEIDDFLNSIRFHPGDKQPSWKIPLNWESGASTPFSIASFQIKSTSRKPIKLTISKARGGLLENINRWRAQIGLESISQEQFASQESKVKLADGTTFFKIDIVGKAAGGGMIGGGIMPFRK